MTDGSKLVETFCRILPTPQPVRLPTHKVKELTSAPQSSTALPATECQLQKHSNVTIFIGAARVGSVSRGEG